MASLPYPCNLPCLRQSGSHHPCARFHDLRRRRAMVTFGTPGQQEGTSTELHYGTTSYVRGCAQSSWTGKEAVAHMRSVEQSWAPEKNTFGPWMSMATRNSVLHRKSGRPAR